MAHILIIDDDKMICETIANIVHHVGHIASFAHTLEDGLREVQTGNADVVFLDEAGPFELAGNGYAECLRTLLKSDISKIYISVRDNCLNDIIMKFCLRNPDKIITVDNNDRSL